MIIIPLVAANGMQSSITIPAFQIYTLNNVKTGNKMAVTSVGAIYATQSKLLQRIYVPHASDAEIDQQYVGPGESMVYVPANLYLQGGQDAVQTFVGAPTFSGRCAVVDKSTNVVIDHIIADPAIYTHPNGHRVIPHDRTVTGDTWNGNNFIRKFAEISLLTNQYTNISMQNIDTAAPSTKGNILLSNPPNNAVIGLTSILSAAKVNAISSAISLSIT